MQVFNKEKYMANKQPTPTQTPPKNPPPTPTREPDKTRPNIIEIGRDKPTPLDVPKP